MGTHRERQQDEGPGKDPESELAARWSLSDPDRLHVTLDNLTDLADYRPAPTPEPVPGNAPGNGGEHTRGARRRERSRTAARVGSGPTFGQRPPERRSEPGTEVRGQPGSGPRADWLVPAARYAEPLDALDRVARDRAPWARPAERWLLELLAGAAASLAFVSPSVWLIVVTVACICGGIASFLANGGLAGALPGRVLVRAVRLLHPRSSLWAPVLASRTLIVAVVLPAGVAAARWTFSHGTEGAMAAARAGAWTDGFRVLAVLACALLLTSVGEGRLRRAVAVRTWALPATDGTLVMLAVTCLATVGFAIAAFPHPSDPLASRADGLGWLPTGARDAADGLRDDIVTNELNALASCLSSRTDTTWETSYTSENPPDEPDVARFVAGAPPEGRRIDVVTVIMAAHNQLAPWVESIEVEWTGGGMVHTDRGSLPTRQPLVDVERLVAATSKGSQWLENWSADPAVALRCSASPVL